MRRIRRSLLALLMAAGTHAVAQGYYEPIPYYGNSPFLFCTLGAPWDLGRTQLELDLAD